jgi:hypothetical protein
LKSTVWLMDYKPSYRKGKRKQTAEAAEAAEAEEKEEKEELSV